MEKDEATEKIGKTSRESSEVTSFQNMKNGQKFEDEVPSKSLHPAAITEQHNWRDEVECSPDDQKKKDPTDILETLSDNQKKKKNADDILEFSSGNQKKKDADDILDTSSGNQKKKDAGDILEFPSGNQKKKDANDILETSSANQKKKDADDILESSSGTQKKTQDPDECPGAASYQPTFLTALRCESASATMDSRRDSSRWRLSPEIAKELEGEAERRHRYRLLQEAQEDEERRKEALLIRIRALDAELNGPVAPKEVKGSYELPPVSPPSKPAPERERQLLAELFGEKAAEEPREKVKLPVRHERTALPWEVVVDLDADSL